MQEECGGNVYFIMPSVAACHIQVPLPYFPTTWSPCAMTSHCNFQQCVSLYTLAVQGKGYGDGASWVSGERTHCAHQQPSLCWVPLFSHIPLASPYSSATSGYNSHLNYVLFFLFVLFFWQIMPFIKIVLWVNKATVSRFGKWLHFCFSAQTFFFLVSPDEIHTIDDCWWKVQSLPCQTTELWGIFLKLM